MKGSNQLLDGRCEVDVGIALAACIEVAARLKWSLELLQVSKCTGYLEA